MTVEQFYEELLSQINVTKEEIEAARVKRDELITVLTSVAQRRVGPAKAFPAGALASGTQIHPLNDVDTVVEFETIPDSWIGSPRSAMEDFLVWVEPELDAGLKISTHAIKIEYPDEQFTADVVVGRRSSVGILLPECPAEGPHLWIRSHPKRHAALVRERNKEWGSAAFSREIRIIKHLNREWQIRDAGGRKPLSSFHVTALALAILKRPAPHRDLTPEFLERAAVLVREPLADPAGVGDPLEARDADHAATLLADAADKTRRALSAPPDEARKLLLDVFGRPAERAALVGRAPVSVGADGSLIGGMAGKRPVKLVRSHGDRH